MRKIPRVMKKALDACRAANDRLKDAEAGIVRAGKRRDRAIRALDNRWERLEVAFQKSGGVVAVIVCNHDIHGALSGRKLSVGRIVHGQEDKWVHLDPASKPVKRLYAMYQKYTDTMPSLRCVSLFAALVKQLCALEVLSDDDRMVAIDGLCFIKDDNGKWFGVM